MFVAINSTVKETFLKNCNAAKNDLQLVIDRYNCLELPELHTKDLVGLLTDFENTLYNKMTNNKGAYLSIDGDVGRSRISVDRKTAMKIAEKPKGYDALIAAVNGFLHLCVLGWAFEGDTFYTLRFAPPAINDYFTINAGAVVFSKKLQSQIDEAGIAYATTEKGHAVYKFMQKVSEAFVECGVLEHIYSPDVNTLPVDKLTELIESAALHIDIKNKTFRPRVNYSGLNPKLLFDN